MIFLGKGGVEGVCGVGSRNLRVKNPTENKKIDIEI